jgi:hypothetical protein
MISKTSILNAHSISTFFTFDIDIEGVLYRMSHYSISLVTFSRYQRSRKGLSILKFRFFNIEHITFDIVC